MVKLDLKQPVTTRNGCDIKIYHMYNYAMHGAYEEDDVWRICSWSIPHGYCLLPKGCLKHRVSELDLINV